MNEKTGINEIYRTDKLKVILLVFFRLSQAIIPTVQVLLVGNILDLATEKILEMKWLVMLVLCIAYSWTCNSVVDVLHILIYDKLEEENETRLIHAITNVRYEFIENKEFQNRINRVQKKSAEALLGKLEEILALLSMILRIIGIFVILIKFSLLGAIVIILAFLPVVKYSISSGKKQYNIENENTINERKATYFEQVLGEREYADERYLFSYFSSVLGKWEKVYQEKMRGKINGICYWFIKSKVASILAILVILLVLAIMLKDVITNGESIGVYISVASSLLSMIYIIATDFSNSLDRLAAADSMVKERYSTFRLIEENTSTLSNYNIDVHELQEIEFRNVSFCYPGVENEVLKNISFKLKKGECVAFVGENGAGKTTITRLLLGLYQNYKGQILWNGKLLERNLSLPYEKYFSVVSQNFIKYPLTVEENIRIGNLSKETNLKEIMRILEAVELREKILKLDKGINTNLGKLYEDGQDLSNGEWQKLTIARSVYADKEVQILDEPVAALDPMAEARVYKQFSDLMKKDKITILISHRFGGVKNADRIFVIKNGEIIEQGSHEDLINQNGDYTRMYDAQSRWYL